MSLSLYGLFGGDTPWFPLDWTASDDQVRGGSSFSKLDCEIKSVAVFKGNLDIKSLGGAGFASQRTTKKDRDWDLSEYDGISLDIKKADGKKYTFILKDELLPQSPNGREQSTVSWEFNFQPGEGGGNIEFRWNELKPTYRGREKKDAHDLDLKHIKRISIMIRSFFGTQEGDFSLSIGSVVAFKEAPSEILQSYQDIDVGITAPGIMSEKRGSHSILQNWMGWFRAFCMG